VKNNIYTEGDNLIAKYMGWKYCEFVSIKKQNIIYVPEGTINHEYKLDAQ